MSRTHEGSWLFFALLFITPHVLAELLFGGRTPAVVWRFRVIDLIDITVMTAVYVAFFLYLFSKFIVRGSRRIVLLYITLMCLYIGGHFLHFGTNSIDTYLREVRHYAPGQDIPSDVYEQLHFLDEVLSHVIMFATLFSILSLTSLVEIKLNLRVERSTRGWCFLLVAAAILGAGITVSAIEAQVLWAYFPLLAVSGAIVVTYAYLRRLRTSDILKLSFTTFFLMLLLFAALTSVIYYSVFGSFVQPSELVRGR